MKYYNSDINKNRNWLDTDESDPEKIIKDYYNDRCYVYDADNCGEIDVEFAFEINNETVYYKLTYSWYIDYDPEWNIYNEYTIEKIDEPTFDFHGDRDWLDF